MGKKIFKSIVPIAASLLGNALLPGIGGAIGSGLGSLATGSKPLAAAGNALGSYFGGNLLGGGANVGPANSIASNLGSIGLDSVANSLPSSVAGASFGDMAANSLGANLGEAAGSALGGPPKVKGPAQPAPFAPSQSGPMGLPSSLSQLQGLDPQQQETNIATQGVYGGGAGKDEQQYFLNLINNRLVGSDGQLADMSSLPSIDSSYLNQMGLGNYHNSYDLLKGINQYQYA